MTLKGVTFSSNGAQVGSALFVESGEVSIVDSTFTKNDDGRGAIYIQEGKVTVTGSLFLRNASEYVSGISNQNGELTVIGSAFVDGAGSAISSAGTLGLFNSTVAKTRRNYAGENAVYVLRGAATIVNSTIAYSQRIGLMSESKNVTVRNTIIAFNQSNCAGEFVDGGNNLQFGEHPDIRKPTCGEVKIADPKLAEEPGSNGGRPLTLALQAGSAAIDAGNPSVCLSPPISNLDQRRFERAVDGNGDGKKVCDIGAFEFNAKPASTADDTSGGPALPPGCPDVNGAISDVVRAEIPDDSVDGGFVYCRVLLTEAEIVVRSVIDRGVVRATEIFGLTRDGTGLLNKFKKAIRVCLQGNGILLHLDASTTPRVPNVIKAESENSYTCGMIQSAGTVVLVLR